MSERAEFINDKSKINLQAGDLFDRIINLKFVCYDEINKKAEEFVIRSDYELILPNSDFSSESRQAKGFIIRRCTNKPSIKVQVTMVTSNTGTSIGVTVSNFFMLSSDGKHLRSFNESQYRISSLEIVMGYWGQLKDSLDPDTSSIDDYFDIKAIKGADRIVINGGKPIVVTTEKLPPDSALHIKGFVGDIYSSPVAISDITTPAKALEKPVMSSGTDFEQVLFNNITRRYINGNERFKANNLTSVLSYNKVAPISAKDAEKGIKIGDKTIKPSAEGLLDEADAKQYGIKVYLSEEAKKVKIRKLYDGEGNEVDKKVYFEAGWTVGMTVTRIMSYMDKELEYTFSLNGDLLVYTPKELSDPETLSKAFKTQGLYENTVLANQTLYNNRLPAVYNINIDAIATITCPFFTFIQPFQYVEFASRYALTSLVSYYASYKPTIYRFLVIKALISFATVDDVNEVQLTAVSARDSVA